MQQFTILWPRADAAILQFSQNIVDLITPTPADWGLVVGDVTLYTALHTDFQTKLTACAPPVRSKPAVVAKNQSLIALRSGALTLANKIYADPAVTLDMKVQIGVPPRALPKPIPAPDSSPVIEVVKCSGFTVRIRLRDADGARRGRPPGTSGASVFSVVADQPPADIADWKFEGILGRVNKVDITFPSTVTPGSKAYITAFWFNGRKQTGPSAQPLGLNIAGGGVSQAA